MNNILILSDDLTGANIRGQSAKLGIPTRVWIDDQQIADIASEGMVCVVNVESRSLTPDEARRKWTELAEALPLDRFQIIMKKIDSTLRGNIGAEIKALMDTGHFEFAVVAPAFPQEGRITVGGYQLVHDRLLEDSEVSNDPKFPVTKSRVAENIKEQAKLSTGEIHIRHLRNDMLAARISALLRKGVNVLVLDSTTEQDLDTIVRELTGRKVLWIGSAGLAQALARFHPVRAMPAIPSHPAMSAMSPVLAVAGSLSEVTRQQVRQLEAYGFHIHRIDPVRLVAEPYNGEKTANPNLYATEVAEKAKSAIRSGSHVAIVTDSSQTKRMEVKDVLRRCGIDAAEGSTRIAEEMGKIAASIIRYELLSGAILTGGDIAYSTCKHLGIRSLAIIGEVEEGLPLCMSEGDVAVMLVTKAGSFGNPESMVKAATMLIKRSSGEKNHV